MDTDPTGKYQKQVNQAIQNSTILNNSQKWKLKNPKPTPPKINGLIKLHKDNNPIRPVINMRSSPSYNLSSFITKHLNKLLNLPFSYNVKNSQHLIQDLIDLRFETQFRLCSFDISNMYTNIPTEEISVLSHAMKAQSIDSELSRHIISLVQITLNQNYFQHRNEIFQQKDGLAMGASTSSILSEVYLQNLEHNNIFSILMEQKIVAYFRYVDDILIVYDSNRTNISHTLDSFNMLHPKLKFTMETEKDMMINFLTSRYIEEKHISTHPYIGNLPHPAASFILIPVIPWSTNWQVSTT
jgi:hypothetical protein